MRFSTLRETVDINYLCMKKNIVHEYKSTDLFINCSNLGDCCMY